MKIASRLLLITAITAILFSAVSCGKKDADNKKNNKPDTVVEAVTKTDKENIDSKEPDTDTGSSEAPQAEATDEQKAENAVLMYVDAAKKLDFDTMDKYISDSKVLPILDSYTEAYSRYGISDSRIKELSKARLGTYKIEPIASKKSGNAVNVTVKISRVNMESLQNKWMETLCNEYPEYTNLTEEQMTQKTVDVLIQVMIDVLKNAEPAIEEQKDFLVENKSGSWIIKAKNEDFFPAN